MFAHTLKKLPKNTIEITVSIPKVDIATAYDKAFESLLQDFSHEGFRKGKVPKTIAEKHMPKDEIYQKLIRDLLPTIYEEIVKKENLKPVISPKIDLAKAKEDEDWELVFHVAEKPTVDLTNFKDVVKKAKGEAKKNDIWVPGKDMNEKKDIGAQSEEKRQMQLNDILSALLKEIPVEISDLIIEQELNQKLSQLLDGIQKIGLTVDAYLKSKNLTMDDVKKQYTREIEETYKLEFILGEIAEKEAIKVEQADLDKLFANIKTEQERAQAEANAYFYATILRKQKTIDYILSL